MAAGADGVAQRLASFVVGGRDDAVAAAMPLLEANSNGIFRFGEDPGAGNVVKLCGNYMIAATIESCAEALSLAEKSGLNRQDVMTMLNTTIFDCLIYRGCAPLPSHTCRGREALSTRRIAPLSSVSRQPPKPTRPAPLACACGRAATAIASRSGRTSRARRSSAQVQALIAINIEPNGT